MYGWIWTCGGWSGYTLLKLKLYIYCIYLLLNLFYLHKAPKILQFNRGLLDNGCLMPFYLVVFCLNYFSAGILLKSFFRLERSQIQGITLTASFLSVELCTYRNNEKDILP